MSTQPSTLLILTGIFSKPLNAANTGAGVKNPDGTTNVSGTFVDAQDRAWSQLRIWQDANSDGMTDSGELKSLDQLGIAALNTTSIAITINGSYGDTRAYSNFIWADGTLGQSADALFETNGKIARRGLAAGSRTLNDTHWKIAA